MTTGMFLEDTPVLATLVLIKSTAGKYKAFPGVIKIYSLPFGV